MRSLISILDLSVEEIAEILSVAEDIIANPMKYSEVCYGKKLATLFFEPSTRTRLSFEAAMMELGGKVLGFSEAQSSSASKGETVADTTRVVSCYADIIAMRHPGRCTPCSFNVFNCTCYQCRRRRSQPSHSDSYRPSHNQEKEG